MSVHRWSALFWLATLALPLCLVCPVGAGELESTVHGTAGEPPLPPAGVAVLWMSDQEGADAPEVIGDLIEGEVGAPMPLSEGGAAASLSDGQSAWNGYCDGDSCGAGYGQACRPACDRFWIRAEALGWWTQGMSVGPLVTHSPIANPQGQGVLGQPGTRVLYGGEPQMEGIRWGGPRIRFGMWKDCCQALGIQGEYFALGDSSRYSINCDGSNGVVARPFFNAVTNLPDSELVCRQGVITGSVSVDYSNRLESGGLAARINLMCGSPCIETCGVYSRLDFLLGYRFMQLDEHLVIRENLTSVATTPTHFDIVDSFDTRSDFHGVELGLQYERQRGRMSVELLAKLALGNSHDEGAIAGSTATTINGVTTNFVGGLLAQTTNIGEYEQDAFAVIPELGITLGYDITCNLKATLGYTFIYWSHVVRPGDQIDPNVNPNLLPPPQVPFTGPLVPAFAFQDTDFWAQGLNIGLEYRW